MIHKIGDAELVMRSVKKAYGEALEAMSVTDDIVFDVSHVETLDTAGLALILACWHHACEKEIVCHFKSNELIDNAVRAYQIELP